MNWINFEKVLLVLVIIGIILGVYRIGYSGKRLNSERSYQDFWCKSQGGIVEVYMPDKTRCDCLTETHAIEVDFADKRYESLGQSLHYSRFTKKKAGILLIIEKESDIKYYKGLIEDIKYHKLNVDVFIIRGK